MEALFGTKTIERILLFLFVNGKCYGSQLEKVFKKPLTPIQKALLRLEHGGILNSYNEGKTRLYQWNEAYPLKGELESLLNKAYTLLPSDEQRLLHVVRDEPSDRLLSKDRRALLMRSFERLSAVKRLHFRAKCRSKIESGWNGEGQGDVIVEKEGGNTLLFQERGSFRSKEGHSSGFSNHFRWRLDRDREFLSLEHLRKGVDNPVFLFNLVPNSSRVLSSEESHLCGNDCYFGQMQLLERGLRLHWRVIGPTKNEEIDYTYS